MRHLTKIITTAFLIVALTPISAQEPSDVELNIAEQPLSSSLREVADNFDLTIAFYSESTDGLEAPALDGDFSSEAALDTLLADTNLEYTFINESSVAVRPVADERGASDSKNLNGPTPVLMAQNQTSAQQSQLNRAEVSVNDEQSQQASLDEIVVTGTLIRGIAPESSPTRLFSREDIINSGAATAQDFIQTLPQNFSGGSNASIPTALPNDNSGGANAGGFGSFGSSVNLRGLGSGSTLVLLNGRRTAPSSFNADFTDISMIPASAIERVETLTDGASSIYGSDAIAGVVNFVLRDDFDGIESSIRYGVGTESGAPSQYRANLTAGRTWNSGNALVTYEYFNQDELRVEDRSFAQQDVLENYLLPSQERHSILATANQNLTDNIEVFVDFTFSNRDAEQLRTLFRSGDTLQNDVSSENLNFSSGGTWNFGSDWYLDVSGTYSSVDTRNQTIIGPDRTITTDSEMWALDAILSGSLLSLPGGDVKIGIGGQYREESFIAVEEVADEVNREGSRDISALFAEVFVPFVGPDNAVPGIVRLEANISGRYEKYSDFGSTSNPKIGLLYSPVEGLSFRGTYNKSFQAPPLGRVGDNFFGASALNSSFIDLFITTPIPDPSLEDAVILTVSGTARDLDPETSEAFSVGFDVEQNWDSNSLALSVTGFDIDFEGRLGTTPIPGNLSILEAVNIAFENPGAFPEGTVIFSPTMQEITALLDSLSTFANPFGDDPLDAVAINNAGIVRNLSRTKVRGIDFDLSYALDAGAGSVQFGLDGTYLLDVERQAATTTPILESVNTLFNPVDLKLRGRAGYAGEKIAANLFVNYIDSYGVDRTPTSESIESWTTVDLSFSYDTGDGLGESVFGDTVFRVSLKNLFDQDPPTVPVFPNLAVDGYDPTNASPLGRFLSFEISKRW